MLVAALRPVVAPAAGPLVAPAGSALRLVKLSPAPAPNAPANVPGDAAAAEAQGLTALQKRARRKAYAKGLALALANVTTDERQARGYRSTAFVCGEYVEQSAGKLTQRWCGRRWCAACAAIRTARAIDAYAPAVAAWSTAERKLVTLTVPNCTGEALRDTLRQMHHVFGAILRSRPLRRLAPNVEALRATECTYSEQRGDYHPHIHALVRGDTAARELVRQWLQRFPAAVPQAQDIRTADRGALAEVFKYGTKLASDKRDADGSRRIVPPRALDTMFRAMRGLRLWQATGIAAANGDDTAADDSAELQHDTGTAAPKRPAESVTWQWSQAATDWVDRDTGEALSEYTPGRAARLFLDKLAALVPAPRGGLAFPQGATEQKRSRYERTAAGPPERIGAAVGDLCA